MSDSLLQKYEVGGNPLAPPSSPATPQTQNFAGSTLHDTYSINGNPNRFGKFIPSPSQLDLNGVNPKGALNDPNYGQINDSFKNGTYLDNAPEGVSF